MIVPISKCLRFCIEDTKYNSEQCGEDIRGISTQFFDVRFGAVIFKFIFGLDNTTISEE